ncbi:uncharacterized protein LOC124392120 isoform X3 [Silurus meridionalis]|uniref:uncharacterized protein LOC124392120 isoform X3 n=1 Tax=Silurus meridionalis TaxID=175797 RepID=UPI001EECA377|nr:uncharacterized protein LOC124392120 isoform X3 [Silurus meridionalis]
MLRGGSVLEMAAYLLLFTLQLLFGLIRPSLLQNISADLISVSPGANITLLCNITNYSQKSWYQMISAGLRQIISARQSSLNKHFYVDYNVDESHFYLTESSSSVSLVIIGVRETDLGFYYCGGRNDETHIQFGKLIRLNFTGGSNNGSSSEASDSQPPARNVNDWIRNVIVMCVCFVSVLITICMCVFCSRVLASSVTPPTPLISCQMLMTHNSSSPLLLYSFIFCFDLSMFIRFILI